jgi:Condensation domain
VTTDNRQSAGFRLSPQQERAFLAGSLGASFRAQIAVELSSSVDDARLRAAVDAVVQRHEILRTTFPKLSGLRVPAQAVSDWLPPLWEVQSEGEHRLDPDGIRRLASEEAGRPLDLESGPVL